MTTFTIMRSIFVIILIFQSIFIYAQLDEYFSDGELFTNPSWSGDISDFEVIDQVLKLNAEEGGKSTIFTSVDFPDSIVWDLNFKMEFAPSNSNKLSIILASNGTNFEETKAYYLEIGETGSLDALTFYYTENGDKQILAKATEGSLAQDPSEATIRITFDSELMWTISADYNSDGNYVEEIVYYDDQFSSTDYNYFGIRCNYTETRKDKFHFDHFVIDSIKPDITPPSLINYQIINDQKIQLNFNEALEEVTSLNLNNYSITPELIVESIGWDIDLPNQLTIETDSSIKSGQSYILSVKNISDIYGNTIAPIHLEFYKKENAVFGDLVINEVLFNPSSDGFDFVEISNRSKKNLKLDSLILYNATNNSKSYIITDKILMEGEIIVFTKDKTSLTEIYPKSDINQILENNIPSLNNSDGNISIGYLSQNQVIMLDSFNYSEAMHFPLLEDVNGVSLERIDQNGNTNNEDNWHSGVSSYNYASPGITNAISTTANNNGIDLFNIETEIFSPDNDGVNDVMILNHQLDQNDYIVSISIYNRNGILVKHLLQNETLSTNGSIFWDGTNNNNNLCTIGIYIIHINFSTFEGNLKTIKKTSLLARRL